MGAADAQRAYDEGQKQYIEQLMATRLAVEMKVEELKQEQKEEFKSISVLVKEKHCLNKWHEQWTEMDTNESGEISWDEYEAWLMVQNHMLEMSEADRKEHRDQQF